MTPPRHPERNTPIVLRLGILRVVPNTFWWPEAREALVRFLHEGVGMPAAIAALEEVALTVVKRHEVTAGSTSVETRRRVLCGLEARVRPFPPDPANPILAHRMRTAAGAVWVLMHLIADAATPEGVRALTADHARVSFGGLACAFRQPKVAEEEALAWAEASWERWTQEADAVEDWWGSLVDPTTWREQAEARWPGRAGDPELHFLVRNVLRTMRGRTPQGIPWLDEPEGFTPLGALLVGAPVDQSNWMS